MSSTFRPMLAETVTADLLPTLRYPLVVMPKLDGLRSLRRGTLLSRTLKPVPNRWTRGRFDRPELEGLDGELIVGSPTDPKVFAKSQSGVMTEGGIPPVKFFVFDSFNDPAMPYSERLPALSDYLATLRSPGVVVTPWDIAHSPEEVDAIEDRHVIGGYEGVILRSMDGAYKFGRSTLKQQWMLKLKRFETSEAVILDFIEGMTNGNEAKLDERGFTKRSSHKANMIPNGTLGAIRVRDIKHGWEFEIGTGFDAAERAHIWATKEAFRGQVCSYQYFPLGMKDLPRFPSWRGLRHKDDL